MPPKKQDDIPFAEKFKFKDQAIYLVVTLSIIFISIGMTYAEQFYILLLPFILIAGWLTVNNIDKTLLLISFLTPLSIPLKELMEGQSFDVALPTEPLMLVLTGIFFLKLAIGERIDKKVVKHPISIAVAFYLAWIFITSVVSSDSVVSLKFFAAKMWFIIPLFFMAAHFFSDEKVLKKYIWLYVGAMVIVLLYTLVLQVNTGIFTKKVAYSIMQPFFKDHTSYGAVIAMFIPFIFVGITTLKMNKLKKLFTTITFIIFMLGLIFSYTRAAWLSIVGAIGVWNVVKIKVKLVFILMLIGILGSIVYANADEIFSSLAKNKVESSTNLADHVSSVSNVSSDASNLERINRWNSAYQMFLAKPLFGYGPGTYMFEYAPFQDYREKTIISTNNADGGNAHSEYLGPLSESGIIGMLSFLAIIFLSIHTGIKVFRKAEKKEHRAIAMALLLGLVTYYMHGFLNNYLDLDKASVPFWGFTAGLVALDVFQPKKKNPEKEVTAPPLDKEEDL